MELSGVGVFAFMDAMTGAETGRFAREVERLGYSALWYPEWIGREAFSHAACLLGTTERLIVATGIAGAFRREPLAAGCAARTLGELYDGRFIMGLGVSHGPSNQRVGIAYDKPLSYMRNYVAAVRSAPYTAPAPKREVPIVIAALLPKMLKLAAAETHGTVTYFAPVSHTRIARAAIGPEKWVCVTQVVMLEDNPQKARAAARAYVNHYIRLPNYQRHLLMLGFEQADFGNGASDRLVDAIVAWGDAQTLRQRVAMHYAAGATHVSILPLRSDPGERPGLWFPDERTLETLAPTPRAASY